MTKAVTVIGLVGDYDAGVTAHRAIPLALEAAGRALGFRAEGRWIATDRIREESAVGDCDGLWCVPGSPYRNMEGALLAIRHARESGTPFLGTCGGFQHAVIEYARSVLGWHDADHAESAPAGERLVIERLDCPLVESTEQVRLAPGSRIAAAYGSTDATEGYHCRYGMNPAFAASLLDGPLRATAHGARGEVRAIELASHPFFVATLFQPERAALHGEVPPLVRGFLGAMR